MINLDVNKIVDSGILTRIRPRRRRWIIPVFAALTIITTAWAFRDGNQLGYKAGWQDAMVAIKRAVVASQYPVVKVVWPSKKPIAIISGEICQPIDGAWKLPTFYHIEYVSPADRPCGPGKPGQPYVDSAGLSAINEGVQHEGVQQ